MASEASPPITGKVADIMDRYSIIINKGQDAGVKTGMIFQVLGGGGDVLDPDTGKSLGAKPIEKLRVKVSQVYPQFAVAETYRLISPPNLQTFFREMSARGIPWNEKLATSVLGPLPPERERIMGQPEPSEPAPTNPVVKIDVGDTVRELQR
jgi:hypothetical protein